MEKYKQQKGFSLVEAVVTTAIIALMSALVLTGTNGAREKFQVRNAAQQFASDLRETIQMTKNGVNAGNCKTVNPNTNRECSSYKIVVQTGGGGYDRKVTVNSVDYGLLQSTLQGGVGFIDTPSISFEFLFPSVIVSAATAPAPNFTLVSKNNPNIKTCVSVVSSGAVSVKSGACI
jgi:prepilin-type N-terminal cleavage/methylation domain-containing protein